MTLLLLAVAMGFSAWRLFAEPNLFSSPTAVREGVGLAKVVVFRDDEFKIKPQPSYSKLAKNRQAKDGRIQFSDRAIVVEAFAIRVPGMRQAPWRRTESLETVSARQLLTPGQRDSWPTWSRRWRSTHGRRRESAA